MSDTADESRLSGFDDAATVASVIRQHAGWVYAAARRMVRDVHTAEDVTQATFLLLHRKAPVFAGEGQRVSWLHRAVRFTSATALRAERRRRRRDTEALVARDATRGADTPAEWLDLAPMLDELVARLSADERAAILLRFYRQQSFTEIADALVVSEDAARKRVQRAVERLRQLAGARGTALTAAALATALAANTTAAAPAGLIGAATIVAKAPSIASPAVALVSNGAATLMTYATIKIAITIAAVGAITLGAGVEITRRAFAQPASPTATPTAADPARADAASTPFVGRLRNGVSIELCGVSDAPSGPATWWNADGSPLAQAPYAQVGGSVKPNDGQLAREFAVRIADPNAADENHVSTRLGATGASSTASWTPADANGGTIRGMDASAIALPDRPATLRYEIAAGPWKTIAQETPGRGSLTNFNDQTIVFGRAVEERGSVSIDVTDTTVTGDARLRVTDRDGNVRTVSSGTSMSGGGKLRVMQFSIDKMSITRIESVAYQTRPFDQWIELRDVSMHRGAATQANVVTSDDPNGTR